MYQAMEIYMARKRKVPHFVPNTYRLFNENLVNFNLDEVKSTYYSVPKKHEKILQPRSPSRNNMPHPYYARFITDNVRYLREPVSHIETGNTMNKQMEWWPSGEQSLSHVKPAYDMLTTQRSDYKNFEYSNSQTRHSSNPHKYPVRGIVPLSSPKDKTRLPKLLQEEISYIHKYDSRLTHNEPIRGKRHGAFVWREIKTASGSVVPQGTKLFLNATGSHSLEQPQTGKGNSVKSSMTSPNLCLQSSQQMFNSATHLSKTDLRETARTCPRSTARVQSRPGVSQTSKSLVPIGELVSRQPTESPM